MAVEFKVLNDNVFISSTTRIKDNEYDGLVNLNNCDFIKTLVNVSEYVSYGNNTYQNISMIVFVSGKEQFVWIYSTVELMTSDYNLINTYLKTAINS